MSWKGWVTLLVAIWLVISAFIPGIVDSQGANLANFLIVGILFLITGIPMLRTSKTAGWIITLVAIWLVISAFITGITGSQTGAMTNGLIFGIIALIFSFFDKKQQ